MVYIVVFIISIFFTWLSQKHEKKRFFFVLFSLIAIIIPAGLAGFRNTGIGTDTLTYGESIFSLVKSTDGFKDFISAYWKGNYYDAEFLYLFLNFIVSRFFSDVGWLYFFSNLIVIVFFYLSAYTNRKRASMWLIMTFCLLLFYNTSLNIMRQSIAISMTLYAYKFIENRRGRHILLWGILIFLAHRSGIIYFILLLLTRMYYLDNKKIARLFSFVSILSTLVFFLYFNNVVAFLSLISSGFSKYQIYTTLENKTGVTSSMLILYLFLMFILFIANRRYKGREIGYYLYMKCFGVTLSLSSLITIAVSRISWYINVLDCIFIPRSLRIITQKNKEIGRILTVITIIFLFVVWYWMTIIGNANETYPYKSTYLGI